MLFKKRKRGEVLAPTGSYFKMDNLMLDDNPDTYLKIREDVTPEKVARKISFWESLLDFLFFPLRK